MEEILQSPSMAKRAMWLVQLRWVAIGALVVATFVSRRFLGVKLASEQLYYLAGGLLVYNAALYGLLRWLTRSRAEPPSKAIGRVISLQISGDLAILTTILHFSGGIENPFAFFFVFHMIIASILRSPAESYVQAALACLLFGAVVVLEYAEWIRHYPLEGFAGHGLYRDGVFVLGTLFVFCVTLFLVVYMTTSIAQQVRAQQADLELANRQLKEQDKLKNEYVLRVSHDVKGHLAAIQSCIDTVHDGLLGPLNDAQKDMIGRAHRRTAQALAFVTDLLRLTHMKIAGKVQISCFPVRAMVAKAIGAVRDRAEAKSIGLSAEISPSLDIICGEQLLLEETLENLLFNAVRYTPAGGKVRLEVFDQGQEVVINVMDTGIGIPWDEMPHIFEEFYRASNARAVDREGTGLGLSFAKQVVERHGGRISVQNNQGGGCTFTIVLPKGADRGTGRT